MKIFEFDSELWLDRPRREVFPFFADPLNLETITPPWLRFKITTPAPLEMRRGVLIDYRLRLHGFPLKWQSKITVWDPPHRFVDEQVRGPYRLWRHEHRFEEKGGGTLVFDHVEYAVPGGFLIQKVLVGCEVARIFEFRRGKLREIFSGRSAVGGR
jgi:ligand-binding SRPBCC domain-containing protein